MYNFSQRCWSYIESMIKRRRFAACTVFEGKIVVSGGDDVDIFRSVESYDHHDKKWIYLPDMIEKRYRHS